MSAEPKPAPLSEEDLDRYRALLAALPSLDWEVIPSLIFKGEASVHGYGVRLRGGALDGDNSLNVYHFVAKSPKMVSALLAEIRHLRAVVALARNLSERIEEFYVVADENDMRRKKFAVIAARLALNAALKEIPQ